MGKARPLVIISDGFSGRIAAVEAARCGLRSIVLDGSDLPSQFPSFYRYAYPELADFIQVGSQVRVLGIFEGREILWSQGETSGTFVADHILLATGAWDRLLPFPGWELPGVISHEELAARIHSGEGFAEKRAIVAGAGDLLQASANGLRESGVEVVAVLDVNPETRHDVAPPPGFPLLRAPCPLRGPRGRSRHGGHFREGRSPDLDALRGSNPNRGRRSHRDGVWSGREA